jgi:cytochrome P450
MEKQILNTALPEQAVTAAKDTDASPTSRRTFSDLPGPKGVPLLGNTFQIKSNRFHQALEKWASEFGDMYQIRLAGHRWLVISDNTIIGNLLRERPDAIRRSSRGTGIINELGITGLFTDEGDEWRKQRKLVMRAFTPEVIRNFFPTMEAMTLRLLRRWQAALASGQSPDVLRDLKAYTLDVTIGLAMGQDINTLEHHHNPLQTDIDFIFNRVARRLTTPFPYWRYLKLPIDHAADKAAKRIRQAIIGFIAQTRAHINQNPELRSKPTNVMEALIAARDEPNSEFTDEHVIGNAITLVFAGEDTTSNTIAWLLNFVARDREASARIATEVDAVLNGTEILQDFKALDQFTFTEAATTEAMRLKPVAALLALETNKELVIGDTLVPAGTDILTCMRHTAMQENHFSQHDAFRPERWLSDQAAAMNADPARKLFPFGGGPRFCPGRFLAMTEIKMVVSMIARNFTVTIDQNAPPVEESFRFTMTPSALPVRLVQR